MDTASTSLPGPTDQGSVSLPLLEPHRNQTQALPWRSF